jgi:hypothetical protein
MWIFLLEKSNLVFPLPGHEAQHSEGEDYLPIVHSGTPNPCYRTQPLDNRPKTQMVSVDIKTT